MVAFTVNAEGLPGQPAVAQGSGSTLLDQAAMAHLQTCIDRFEAELAGASAQAAAAASGPSDTDGRPPATAEPLPPGTYRLPIVWRLG